MRLCSHRGRGSQGPRFFLVKKWEILPKAKGLAASFCSSKRYTSLCVWVRTPHITVWECVEKSTRNLPWGHAAPQNADRRETSKQLKIIGPRLDLYWECHTLTPNFETIFRDKKSRPFYREISENDIYRGAIYPAFWPAARLSTGSGFCRESRVIKS